MQPGLQKLLWRPLVDSREASVQRAACSGRVARRGRERHIAAGHCMQPARGRLPKSFLCLDSRSCLLCRPASRPQRPLRGRERRAGARAQPGLGPPEHARKRMACRSRVRRKAMLRIYDVVLEAATVGFLRRIELRDRELARQLRRCSSSVALNLVEGMYSRGMNRGARYHSALLPQPERHSPVWKSRSCAAAFDRIQACTTSSTAS